MRQEIRSSHEVDADGKPAGGHTNATGITIVWQNGPLGRGEDRIEPNGAFVEGVLEAAADRLRWYQESEFACDDNAEALALIEQAQTVLDKRTADREARGVEGTHTA
jgi:hypothetical protein